MQHRQLTCSSGAHDRQESVGRNCQALPADCGHFRPLLRNEHDKQNEELANDFLTNEIWLAAIYLNGFEEFAMIMWTFGQLAMAFDCSGLNPWVRKLSCNRANRLIAHMFGRDINRVGPTSTGSSRDPAAHRTYGLARGHVGSANYKQGFPRELMDAILGNISAVEWLGARNTSNLVWSAFSQNDLESGPLWPLLLRICLECQNMRSLLLLPPFFNAAAAAATTKSHVPSHAPIGRFGRFVTTASAPRLLAGMNVSVGPGGHKYDMRGTEHQLMREARFTVDGMDPDNIAAQPVAANAPCRQVVIDNETAWDDCSMVAPQLGPQKGGQVRKTRRAKASARGKPRG